MTFSSSRFQHAWQRISERSSLSVTIAIAACLQFIVLTSVAMLVYPGGSSAEKTSTSYRFFENFFSDLGRTVTEGGLPNLTAAVLFFIALSGAGVGLVVFYLTTPIYFRSSRLALGLSLVGSVFGVTTGIAFVGVAFTPANLARGMHFTFVLTAFRAFIGVAAFYSLAIAVTGVRRANSGYPKRYAAVYLAFTILLAGYIALITRGPDLDTLNGVIIQATGQKIIVYAAIACVLTHAMGLRRLSAKPAAQEAQPGGI